MGAPRVIGETAELRQRIVIREIVGFGSPVRSASSGLPSERSPERNAPSTSNPRARAVTNNRPPEIPSAPALVDRGLLDARCSSCRTVRCFEHSSFAPPDGLRAFFFEPPDRRRRREDCVSCPSFPAPEAAWLRRACPCLLFCNPPIASTPYVFRKVKIDLAFLSCERAAMASFPA